jgi:hypothetical protein
MKPITRRRFIASATLSAAAISLRAQGASPTPVTLKIPAQATGPHIPADYIGLSYEVRELTNPSFFSPANTGLIRQFKAISPHGVLRLGGNSSEFGWWKATPDSPEPEHPKTREVEGEPKAQFYAVTAEAVRNLAGFLKAANWTCLYGIGMGTNTPVRAAEEAAFVAKTLGPSLQYFQIGNEADLFSNHLRDPKTWSAKAYLDEWLAIAQAVTARVPNAIFGMPDVAANVGWLTRIADLWPTIPNPPHVTTLTHHYYFGGPATNPAVNIPNLLSSGTMARVQNTATTASAAAGRMHARVRMTEGNTCYRGGKPGVSDVFAAALWSADYALLLAANNYSGVNLHGGTETFIASSVGGFLPGDIMLKDAGATPDQIAAHPHPFYTPIASIGSEYVLEPVAYGLKFAGAFAGATLLPGDFTAQLQATGANATAYAALLPSGHPSVILLNKDPRHEVSVILEFAPAKSALLEIETLHASSLDAREAHITKSPQPAHLQHGKYTATVPPATALRLTLIQKREPSK